MDTNTQIWVTAQGDYEVFLTNSDQDIKPHCEEEQGGGWEERWWVMIQRLLLTPLPRQGGLQEKGEAKRADREKQASPHFPVCVVFGQSKKSPHAHTKTDTHHHVSNWLHAQSEDVRGQRPQQPNHLRLLLHSGHVGRWTERSPCDWLVSADALWLQSRWSFTKSCTVIEKKIIRYILIVSGFKVTFHKNEQSQQIFSPSSLRQSHKQKAVVSGDSEQIPDTAVCGSVLLVLLLIHQKRAKF